MFVTKIRGRQLCLKWLMSSTSNVAFCLLNCHKITQGDTTEEPPFVASNETMDHVCESVGVGDVLLDTGFISGVHTQPIALYVDLSFMEPEFMPEYVATFRDERVEDSADDRPVPELSKRDNAVSQGYRLSHSTSAMNGS
jgi:hypothetical protein